MKYTSGMLTSEMSGAMGSVVASHNAGGPYLRLKGLITKPMSYLQQIVQNAFGTLAVMWKQDLTTDEKDSWTVWGANSPMKDVLGRTFYPKGLNAFISINTLYMQAGITILRTAPVLFGQAAPIIPNIANVSISVADQQLIITAAADLVGWSDQLVDDKVLVYISEPMSPGVNFFKGPFQYSAKIVGAAIPPTFPTAIDVPKIVALGQKVFIRLVHVSEIGQNSPDSIFSVIAVA